MKKESIIAIVFGLVLGLVFSLFLINQSKNQQISQIKPIKNQKKVITPTVKPLETVYLDIVEPKTNFITQNSSLKIKGKANKNNLLLIVSPLKEIVFENKKEDFETELPLGLGENVIQISLYHKNASVPLINKTVTVYYLPANE